MTRRILIAVTGLSPQIVTETLYGLSVMQAEPWVPDEVHLISTSVGAENARLQLISELPGWFGRFCEDYELPPIRFGAEQIHVIPRPDGSHIDDIRDDEDNTLAADFICKVVQELTCDPDSEIVASIAGGRKTMGFYLGYAMSLYGRQQDRLTHVLVSEPFETLPDFFYPTRQTRVIHDRKGLALDCRNAKVWLGDIPFVRLRDNLPKELLAGTARYSDAVAGVQKKLPGRFLSLDPSEQTITCGGQAFTMSPVPYCFYWVFAERASRGLPGLHWSEPEFVEELLAKLKRLSPSTHASVAETYRRSYDKENFDPNKSKVNDFIRKILGEYGAEPYLLKLAIDKIPETNYRRTYIDLPPGLVVIVTVL